MKKNKVLFIIGLVLVTIVVGVSFGYFLLGVTITGKGSLNTGKVADLLHILYDGGTSPLTGENLVPGDTIKKEDISVTITPGSDTDTATFAIILKITENSFVKCSDANYVGDLFAEDTNVCEKGAEELVYKLIETTDGSQEEIATGDLTGKTGDVKLAKITKTTETQKTYTYTLEITFKDLTSDQNHNAGKSFSGSIDVEFANEIDLTPAEETLASLNLHKNGDIGKIIGESCGSCTMEENGLYQTEDNDGVSYIFRGSVSNNWVKFADMYWRIIRINGDGSIRLIYAGESSSSLGPKNNGTNIATGTSNNYVKYNDSYGDNTYVGFTNKGSNSTSYDDAHGGTTSSNILNQLNKWFTDKKLDQSPNIDHIEKSAGFCNDRGKPNANTHGSSYTQEGFGTHPTIYGPAHRVMQSNSTSYVAVGQEQKPTLKCGMDYSSKTEGIVNDTYLKRDLYTASNDKNIGNEKLTNPVGLITSDEVILAGGFAGQTNDGYWLNTDQYYWTMSPKDFDGSSADVFFVNSDGTLDDYFVNGTAPGVRPVINLKATTTFTAKSLDQADVGTSAHPYEVE